MCYLKRVSNSLSSDWRKVARPVSLHSISTSAESALARDAIFDPAHGRDGLVNPSLLELCLLMVHQSFIGRTTRFLALTSNAEQALLSKNLAMLRSDLPFYMVPFSTEDLTFMKPEDNGEKFTILLTAISAYAEGFSPDSIIRKAFYLWKKLERQ